MFRNKIHFTLNGALIELGGQNVFAPLSDTLRYHLRKTGTKVVCAEGDCGACTVMLARVDAVGSVNGENSFRAINACIYPTFSVDGCHIVTVEGMAQATELHEIQNSMVKNFGAQCGFCTPGFIMAIANLYEHKEKPSEKNVKNYLTGNLCRCTGYQPIIEAAMGVDAKKMKSVSDMYPLKKESEFLKTRMNEALLLENEENEVYAPLSLKEVVRYKEKHPLAKIFSGSTDLGVQINKGKKPAVKRLSLHLIPSLNSISFEPVTKTPAHASPAQIIRVGARVTFDQLQTELQESDPDFSNFLNIFASPQIKNAATLTGNLANASPIADATPYLFAVDAQVNLLGHQGARQVPVCEFFKSYKVLDIAQDEFITDIFWPALNLAEVKVGLYKVSQRRDLDISCVNACYALHIRGDLVTSARIVYGGVGPVPLRLNEVENFLVGKKIDRAALHGAQDLIEKSIQPLTDARGTSEFRIMMARQLFHKFIEEKFTI